MARVARRVRIGAMKVARSRHVARNAEASAKGACPCMRANVAKLPPPSSAGLGKKASRENNEKKNCCVCLCLPAFLGFPAAA